MPNTRKKEAAAHEAATKVAEGIGEALAGIVNRLESLDTERESVYRQLLGLQKRFNPQVARFGEAIGQTVTTRATKPVGKGRRPPKKAQGSAAKSAKKTTRRATTSRTRQKSPVRCGICGTVGHNARGHAKWEASQGQ